MRRYELELAARASTFLLSRHSTVSDRINVIRLRDSS